MKTGVSCLVGLFVVFVIAFDLGTNAEGSDPFTDELTESHRSELVASDGTGELVASCGNVSLNRVAISGGYTFDDKGSCFKVIENRRRAMYAITTDNVHDVWLVRYENTGSKCGEVELEVYATCVSKGLVSD